MFIKIMEAWREISEWMRRESWITGMLFRKNWRYFGVKWGRGSEECVKLKTWQVWGVTGICVVTLFTGRKKWHSHTSGIELTAETLETWSPKYSSTEFLMCWEPPVLFFSCPLPKTSLLWAAQTGAPLWPRTWILILKLLLQLLIIGTSKNELPSPRWVDILWILIWPVLHPNCHVWQAMWLLMSFLSSTSLYFLLSTSKLCRIMKCSLFHLRAHPLKNVTTKEDKGWLRMNNEQ